MITSVRLSEPDLMPMMCIEMVSTAPWNRPEIEKPARFRARRQSDDQGRH